MKIVAAFRKALYVKWIMLAVLLCGSLGLFLLVPKISLASYNGYSYERLITIDSSKVSTASGTPADLIFSSSSDCTATSTGWEIESYNSSTGNLIAWVNNGTLSPSAGLTFYICYDNPAITSFQGSSTTTWNSNYAEVLHMSQNPSSAPPQILDSTANAPDLSLPVGEEVAARAINQ